MKVPTNTPQLEIPSKIERLIGHLKGLQTGPTVVFFAGIHGNEPAGVIALDRTFDRLKKSSNTFCGELFGISGNLTALSKQVRFINEDLNRIWLPNRFGSSTVERSKSSVEEKEMYELNDYITDILKTTSPPHYFIDLHTTSGQTPPFVVMNDSLLNRRFTSNYPLPIILGIEEYLEGALLSHINEMGYVSFGFESGQHNDKKAILNAENFILYTLGLTGFYRMKAEEIKERKSKLKQSGSIKNRFYEIYHQHKIEKGTLFKMLPGFRNFEHVPRKTSLAINGSGLITTEKKRQLFMPLYQKKGSEGFYYIRHIPISILWLSKKMRILKFDGLLAKLPGIEWASQNRNALVVDKRVARVLAKPIFHVLGYRTRTVDKNHWVLKSREHNSRKSDYKNTNWS